MTTPPVDTSREAITPVRLFPMQGGGPPIPWNVAETIYAVYAAHFGADQSLERLAQRGGFGWDEVTHIYNERGGKYSYGKRLDELRAAPPAPVYSEASIDALRTALDAANQRHVELHALTQAIIENANNDYAEAIAQRDAEKARADRLAAALQSIRDSGGANGTSGDGQCWCIDVARKALATKDSPT